MPATPQSVVEFPDSYIEACFYEWYRAGRPRLSQHASRKIIQILPVAPDGRKPSFATILRWARNRGWFERADALDAQTSIELDRVAVEDRIRVLRELAGYGEKLLSAGMKYIEKHPEPFADNPSSAVRAVVAGSEMMFKYTGAADKLALITRMSDKQIERELMRLLGQDNKNDEDDDAVEGEEVSQEADANTESDNT